MIPETIMEQIFNGDLEGPRCKVVVSPRKVVGRGKMVEQGPSPAAARQYPCSSPNP